MSSQYRGSEDDHKPMPWNRRFDAQSIPVFGLWEQITMCFDAILKKPLHLHIYLRLHKTHIDHKKWPMECTQLLQDSIAVIHRVGTSTDFVHRSCIQTLSKSVTAGGNPIGFFNLGRWAVLICIAEVPPQKKDNHPKWPSALVYPPGN